MCYQLRPQNEKKHISGGFAANEIPHIIHGSKNGLIANTDPKQKTWPTLDCLLPE